MKTKARRNAPDTGSPLLVSEKAGPITASPKDGRLRMSVFVKPGASLSRITEINNAFVGVSLAAPPRDGEANLELISFLSKVPYHCISNTQILIQFRFCIAEKATSPLSMGLKVETKL